MHEVFMTSITPQGAFQIVDLSDFAFSTCGYTYPSTLPFVFGHSGAVSETISEAEEQDFRNGIIAHD